MKFLKALLRFITVTAGCVFYAAGISVFLDPFSIAPGGITGVAVILGKVIDIPVGIIILVLNVPIIILGFIKFGKGMIFRTIYAVVLSSLLMDLSPYLIKITGYPTENLLLCAFSGGALMAVGMGIILANGYTTGGIDIIIKVLRQKYKYIRSGTLYLIFDTAIIIATAIVFRDVELAMYAAIAVVVQSILLDIVLYSRDGAKMVFIVSKKNDAIADVLMNKFKLGATYVESCGAYTNSSEKMLMCVFKKHFFSDVREAVCKTDPCAFMIVTNATEIYGEGFKAHDSQEI